MPYIAIENFKRGMDRSRRRFSGESGTLYTLENGVISRGGDIERRKKFVAKYTLSTGETFGMDLLRNQVHVFGSIAEGSLATAMPVGVVYQRLQHPGSGTLTRVLDSKAFDGALYAIGEYDDGNIYHYYDGTRISDWDTVAAEVATTLNALAESLAAAINARSDVEVSVTDKTLILTSTTAGTSFTIAASATNAATAKVTVEITAGTSNPGVNTVSAVTVDAVNLMNATVNWTTSHANTASLVKDQINAKTGTTGWAATVSDTVVTATKAGADMAAVATVTVNGDVEATVTTVNGLDDQAVTVATPQANVAAVAETRASGTIQVTGGTSNPGVNRISSITVNSVELLNASVNWSSSNATTALSVSAQINNASATHGYTSTVSTDTVTIQAASGSGATPNGHAIVTTIEGDVTVTDSGTVSGGVAAVTAVAQVSTVALSGTFEVDDTYEVTVNGTGYKRTGLASGTGTSIFVQSNRVWSTARSEWRYSKLNDATDWTDATAGFFNIARVNAGRDSLVATAEYQGFAAIFSSSAVQIWQTDTDVSNVEHFQTIEHTGTLAQRSVVAYGNNDVFFLDTTGIRSLRSRQTGNAYTVDVGHALDDFTIDTIEAATPDQVSRAIGAINPKDARYWLAIGTKIIVLSFYPQGDVSAWSYFDTTDDLSSADITEVVPGKDRMFVRAGDIIYRYGGDSGNVYPDADEAECVVELPFMGGNDSAGNKFAEGMNIVCSNDWDVDLLFNPDDDTEVINVGIFTKATPNQEGSLIPTPGEGARVSAKLVCSAAGEATLSEFFYHFTNDR